MFFQVIDVGWVTFDVSKLYRLNDLQSMGGYNWVWQILITLIQLKFGTKFPIVKTKFECYAELMLQFLNVSVSLKFLKNEDFFW